MRTLGYSALSVRTIEDSHFFKFLAYSSGGASGSGNASACLIHTTCTCCGETLASFTLCATVVHGPWGPLAQLRAPAPPTAPLTRTAWEDFWGSRSAISLKVTNSPAVLDMPSDSNTILPSLEGLPCSSSGTMR